MRKRIEIHSTLVFMFELGAFKLLVWAAWGGVVAWFLTALVTWRGLARHQPLQPLAQSEASREAMMLHVDLDQP